MYPINQAMLDALNRPVYQEAHISFTVNGTTYNFDNGDIIQGSFYVDRYCTSSNRPEFGSAIASEVNFRIRQRGVLYPFEGARMSINISFETSDGTKTIPLGYYTPYSVVRNKYDIEVKAYDDMIKFDKVYSRDAFPVKFMTAENIIRFTCSLCDVTFGGLEGVTSTADVFELPKDTENITYRTLIQWCGTVLGAVSYIDYNGSLKVRDLGVATTDVPEVVFNENNRYSSGSFNKDNQTLLTGVKYTADDGTVYMEGTEGSVLDLTSCRLVTKDNCASVGGWLYFSHQGTSIFYKSFSAMVVAPCPYLFPLDIVHITNPMDGTEEFSLFATHVTYKLNGASAISSVGTDGVNDSGGNGFTSQQASYLGSVISGGTANAVWGTNTSAQTGWIPTNELFSALQTEIDAHTQAISALNTRTTGTIVSEHTIDYQWLMKDALGNVDLRLKVTATAAIAKWGIFATLPTGFRPKDSIRVVGSRGDDIIIYAIDAYGNLQVDKAIASGEAVCTALHMHFNIHGGETSS